MNCIVARRARVRAAASRLAAEPTIDAATIVSPEESRTGGFEIELTTTRDADGLGGDVLRVLADYELGLRAVQPQADWTRAVATPR